MYGPEPAPKYPKVCPRSSGECCRPMCDATSTIPPIPIVEFIANLPTDTAKPSGFPWNKLFIALSISLRLLKKFVTPFLIGSGVTAL